MFSLVQRNFPQNVEISPLSPSLVLPIDDRVTASRSRRLRVLLTGRHGNLATSLQWPKVDGLRAGAPEQTEQKSVHARTRSWTCVTFVALLSLFYPLLSLSPPCFLLFFFSPLVVSLSESRRELLAAYSSVRVDGVCVFVSRLPVETLSRGRSRAVDSDIMEWLDRLRSRWGYCRKKKWEKRWEGLTSADRVSRTGWPTSASGLSRDSEFPRDIDTLPCVSSYRGLPTRLFDTRTSFARVSSVNVWYSSRRILFSARHGARPALRRDHNKFVIGINDFALGRK